MIRSENVSDLDLELLGSTIGLEQQRNNDLIQPGPEPTEARSIRILKGCVALRMEDDLTAAYTISELRDGLQVDPRTDKYASMAQYVVLDLLDDGYLKTLPKQPLIWHPPESDEYQSLLNRLQTQ